MNDRIEILRSIKEKTFVPQNYEQIQLSSFDRGYFDKIIEIVQRPFLPKTKDIMKELDMNDSHVYEYSKRLSALKLILAPTIFELLAVFGYWSGHNAYGLSYKFESEKLTELLYYDLMMTKRHTGRGTSVRKNIERAIQGINHSGYPKYHIPLVSVNSVPVYSKIFS